MAQENGWALVVQLVGPSVALLLGVAGIWSEKIKGWLFGPRLSLEVHEPQGHYTRDKDGRPMRYYLIRVRNKPRKVTAAKVSVRIIALYKLDEEGEEEDRTPSMPLLLEQSANLGTSVDIRSYDAFNVGYMGGLEKEPSKFLIQVHKQFVSFQGEVAPGEKIKFGLEIQADNLPPSKRKYLMLTWQDNQPTKECPWPSIPVLSLAD